MKRAAFLTPILFLGLAGCGGVITYEGTFAVVKAPADDEPLRKWLEGQPGVRDVSVTREGKTVRVRYARDQTRWEFHDLSPPLKELGYEASSVGWKISGLSRLVPGVPDWVVLISAIVAVPAVIEPSGYGVAGRGPNHKLQQTAAGMLVFRDIKALSAAAAAELFRSAAED